MAGAVPKMVSVVNRTLKPLDAMFDGQPLVLLPGYKRNDEGAIVGAGPGDAVLVNQLPYFAAELAKRQLPNMGTEDPENPREFESLIGVIEWNDDIDYLEPSDADERIDRDLLDDEAQTAKKIRTSAGRKAAKLAKRGKGGRRFSDEKLRNPTGIRANYEG